MPLPTTSRAMRSRRQSTRKAFNFGACARRSEGTDSVVLRSTLVAPSRLMHFPSRSRRNSAHDRKWATSGWFAGWHLLSAGCSDKALALGLLASELADATDRFSLFPVRSLGWLLVKSSALHLAKNAFALHFLLQYPKSLVDVVVANDYLQETLLSCSSRANWPNQSACASTGRSRRSDRTST